MTSALDNAMANAQRSRFAAKAAVASSGASALATASTGQPYSSPDLGRHVEQYRHFKDVVYTSVSAIAKRIAGQPVCVARAPTRPSGRKAAYTDALQRLDGHTIISAIDDPNELMVRWSLLFSTAASLMLTGKSYWWMSPTAQRRREIWPIPAHWMRPDDKLRRGWWLRPDGDAKEHAIPAHEVAYFYLPNPADPFGVTSPLSTQAASVNADEQILLCQQRAYRQGLNHSVAVRVGDVLDTSDGQKRQPALTKEHRQQIIDAVHGMFRGVRNRDDPVILDSFIKDVFKLSLSPSDMDFMESGKLSEGRIYRAFGVNPIVTGAVESANRASSWAADNHFVSSTINPILENMSQVLTAWLPPLFSPGENLVVWIEPAVAHDAEQALREYQAGLAAGAVTVNEYRARILGLPPIPGGDELMMPMTMLPRAPAKASKPARHALNGRK